MQFHEVDPSLKRLKAYVLKKIMRTAERGNSVYLNDLNTYLQRIHVLTEQAKNVCQKLDVLYQELPGIDLKPIEPAPAPVLRVVSVQVNRAMIKNHMLVITPYTKQVGYGETMTVITDYNQFSTWFLKAGNKLKERGRIREFYAKRGVKAGTEIILEEFAPGKWYLDTRAERRHWRAPAIIAKSGVLDWGPGAKMAPADKPVIALRPKIKASEN